jgi:hypothetical protein
MQAVASEAMGKLEGNGFSMSVQTEYMDRAFRIVDKPEKAKCVTVSLVISAKDGKPGDEYCISLGAMITRRGIDEEQLANDTEGYNRMVDEALDTLAYYDNKDEGLAFLTAKANEECERFIKEIEEQQKKNRRLAVISNVVFVIGIALLFIIALLR